MDQVKLFNSCHPQILLGPFLNTLSHVTWETALRLKFCYLKIIFSLHQRYQLKVIGHIHIIKLRPRHGHKYTKCKMCPSTIMLIWIKQHLSNIWNSNYERIKQHWWGWVKKNLGYEKTCSSASLLRRGFDKIFENAEYL